MNPTHTPMPRRIGLAVILAAWLPACAPAPQPSAAASAETPATPAVPQSRPDAATVADEQGRYTRLSGPQCRTDELRDELGSTVTTCAGADAYRLVVTDSDARQHLALVRGDGEPRSLELGMHFGGGFNDLGDTVEWWPQGDAAPTALISRFNAYEHPEQPDRTTSYLAVVKLGERPCLTEVIPPAANQNQLARDAAERAPAAPCRALPRY